MCSTFQVKHYNDSRQTDELSLGANAGVWTSTHDVGGIGVTRFSKMTVTMPSFVCVGSGMTDTRCIDRRTVRNGWCCTTRCPARFCERVVFRSSRAVAGYSAPSAARHTGPQHAVDHGEAGVREPLPQQRDWASLILSDYLAIDRRITTCCMLRGVARSPPVPLQLNQSCWHSGFCFPITFSENAK